MDNIDNIYVINMDKDTEKLQKIKKQLDDRNLKFKRIQGVEVSKMSDKEIDENISSFCKYFCSPSMQGIFLSHIKCWKSIIENNDKYAIIFEDDAVLHDKFVNYVENTLKELNSNYPSWDMVYLGYIGLQAPNSILSYFQKLVVPTIKQPNVNGKYIYRNEMPLGLHCYMITNDCAKKLLKYLNKAIYHVDFSILMMSNHFDIYTSKKQLAYQNSTNESSSQITTNFPILLNSIFDNYKEHNVTYSYYLSLPILSVLKYDINIYFVLFLSLLLLSTFALFKQIHYFLLFYLLIEIFLQHENLKVISIWLLILYISFNRNLLKLQAKSIMNTLNNIN
jgi:glycosyl transferase family 25